MFPKCLTEDQVLGRIQHPASIMFVWEEDAILVKADAHQPLAAPEEKVLPKYCVQSQQWYC